MKEKRGEGRKEGKGGENERIRKEKGKRKVKGVERR